jgi:tetratricopeptide (TPR) repeat protein
MFTSNKSPDGPTTSMTNPRGVNVPDINIADANEISLVEAVLMHRAQYARSLEVLRNYYIDHGYDTKRRWADHELNDVAKIKPYAYIIEAEIPSTPMEPRDSVAEADEAFQEAVALMEKGGHGVPVLYREEIMKKALAQFKVLIEKYPNSDKVDDAAFYSGEIHKEYFKDEEEIAVKWYELAIALNPDTPHNVHFQAAVIYDLRMHDRDRAIELYKEVLDRETSKTNRRFAMNRIHFLTQEMEKGLGEKGPVSSEPTVTPAGDTIEAPPAGETIGKSAKVEDSDVP